ncbi:LytR/AlgR family response regulator transcription factor [Ferruginibacter sp. SUN106]|uniref:LytR/AlgR family response regulator transcription factor n=1 Tax=Ferruginibacter sp. SUN106 TaxID=2978348 RepID=UPI003D35F26A
MIRCLVVDDEQHAIDIIAHYIGQTNFLELVSSTTNPVAALQTVITENIDLVFLDIQMPELSGIDFIKAINGKAKVILTTAYSEFAIEGFELDVVDYLLKPIRFPRFLNAVQKVVKANTEKAEAAETTADDNYIFVKTESKGKLLKINLDEIEYIEGMKNYVAIYRGGQKTLVYTNLKDLILHLPAKQFIRIHKSFIIPVNRITGIEGNRVVLKNVAAEILIGESYKEDLMEIIKHRMIT